MARTTPELQRSLLLELIRSGAKGSTLTFEGFTRSEIVAALAAVSLEEVAAKQAARK